MEKESNKMLAFLDVYINNKDSCNLLMSSIVKKLLLDYLLISIALLHILMKLVLSALYLTERTKVIILLLNLMMLKIYWMYLKRIDSPESLISRVVHSYLESFQSSNDSKSATDTSTLYFKLPFLKLSKFTQRKKSMLARKYCKNLNIKLAFSFLKIKNLLTVKDRVHRSLRSRVVYKFSCAGCNSVYIGETTCHLST